MEAHLRLYRTILAIVGQSAFVLDLRNVRTLAWSIVGLLMSNTVHLSAWQMYLAGAKLAASRERQLRRFLHNERVEPASVYACILRPVLAGFYQDLQSANKGKPVPLLVVLDGSLLWDRVLVVRLALVYRGRAIPLAWTVFDHASATVSFDAYVSLFAQAQALLPQAAQVVLLADRGFCDMALIMHLQQIKWHYTIRAKDSFWVETEIGIHCKVKSLVPPKGHIHLYHDVRLTKTHAVSVNLVVAEVSTPDGDERWLLVSDRQVSLDTIREYGLRFCIEENFLDDKSAGFQLEESRFQDVGTLSRLLLVLALATVCLVSTGVQVAAQGERRLYDPHWQRGLSYLRIGWAVVCVAVMTGKPLTRKLWLDPAPDPEPAFASKKQAAVPRMTYSAIQVMKPFQQRT